MKNTLLLLMAVLAGSSASADLIALEAEAYSAVSGSPTFNTVSSAGASGMAITASDNSQGAFVSYAFNLANAGSYVLYARVFSPNNTDDSFYAPTQGEFDGNSTNPSLAINNLSNSNNTSYRWVNTNAGTFVGEGGTTTGTAPLYTMAAGANTFTLRAREDGLMLDAVAFGSGADASITDASILDNALASVVPEPSAAALMILGVALLRLRRR